MIGDPDVLILADTYAVPGDASRMDLWDLAAGADEDLGYYAAEVRQPALYRHICLPSFSFFSSIFALQMS